MFSYSRTRYYTCFPLFSGFFILFVSNISLRLFLMFSCLLFLSSFTRCMIKWRYYWVVLISRFRFVLVFFYGKNFKWIPQWNSVILLRFNLVLLSLTVSLTAIKFSVLSFISRVVIKDSDSIRSLLFSFYNNCTFLSYLLFVSCLITFYHNRRYTTLYNDFTKKDNKKKEI